MKENRKENWFVCCLVRKGGNKILGGAQEFFTWAYTKLVSLKWRENEHIVPNMCVVL